MQNKKLSNAIIFGLSTSKEIAKEVSIKTNIKLGDSEIKHFKDGEIYFELETSVRNKRTFVIQSTSSPVNENLMELLIFIDTLRRSSAKEINLIIPYYGYARQDRKNNGRQPITAALVARLLEEAGANRVISFDLHAPQIQGFFRIPVDDLRAYGLLARAIKKENIKDLIIISPDHGGVSRARSLAKILDTEIAIIDKRRIKANEVVISNLIGNVENKNCVIVDDIIDTGGTIVEGIKILKENKAKDIYVVTTHGLFSTSKDEDYDLVWKKIQKAGAKMIITTNSVNNYSKNSFVKVVNLSTAIADVILKHINDQSIIDHFIKKYNTTI
ncbi:/ prs / Ribose-phosphate pyrophosphokinase /:17730 Forward [Candidatus Hepatoplasma crinochetorum]|uniref:Ribose-phosphate pyrophosphokinase n=1 Tax=Candidatus Hepatoplasma crinochetorum TaxID=295596 RepID=A0A0G7ZN78_9MOLU|nr:/ prs / Ribose-phosphate pyrophosphokinase /:17730 Forward [Candidatus Hepatoplasma crinochetorum]